MTGTIRDTDWGIASEQVAHDGRGVASHAGRSMLRMGVCICVLVLAGSLFVGVAAAEGASEIGNWTELQEINNELDGDYVLVADLNESTEDYSDVVGVGDGFEPIGETNDGFTGTFDGNGHTISNLTITSDEDYVGLFGYVGDTGELTNVSLEAVDIAGNERVGGLVGQNTGSISHSYVTGSVDGSGSDVGGLVGVNGGSSSTDNTISHSYSAVSVDSSSVRVGGLVGQNAFNGEITESYASGAVTSRFSSAVGGLVGVNSGEVITSYATGSATGSFRVGGLIGRNTGTVEQSYASGSVEGSSILGGLVATNTNDGEVTDSYWDIETTGQTESAADATGLTTLQITGDRAVDNLFDFGSTWEAGQDGSSEDGRTVFYPVLQNVTHEPAPKSSLFDGGNGTETAPYQVSTWYQLDYLRLSSDSAVVVDDPHFELTADLDADTFGYEAVAGPTANDDDGFDPIGEDGDEFTGTFDGDGHTISNLVIDQSDSEETPVGLFGHVGGDGEINNVTLVNASVTGDESQIGSSLDRTGALVGLLEGTVTNSSTDADVVGGVVVGGLVGVNSGTVSGSYATGTVDGNNAVGGLVGANGGTVSESYATGTVAGSNSVGGLVGTNGGTVSESYATGTVDGFNSVGGLVGFNDEATVTDSYWDTEATGQDDSAGGLGLTTIEMKGADSSLDGFDFENTWDVVSDKNVSYPFLQAVAQEPAPGLESVENVSVSLADTEIEQGEETSFTVNVSLSESGESEATRVSNLTSSNPANATVDENGTVTGIGVGTVTITGAYGSKEDSAILTVTPGSSVEVDVETEPATSTAGEPLAGPPAVLVTDEFGNPTPGTNVSVTVVDETDALVSGDLEVEINKSGISAFDDLVIETAADYQLEFTINASDDGVDESDTATSEAFTVTPAAAVEFGIETNGLVHTVSNDFTDQNALNVFLTLTDEFGNLVPDAPVNVTDSGTGMMVHPDREQETDENAKATFVIQTATPQENVDFTFTERESGQDNSAVLAGVDFEPALPEARGSASSYTVTLGTDVTFRASDSTAPNGSNPQYNWTFEDDGTEIENATGLTHTTNFSQPATITTTLNVTVANETSTDTFTVDVEDRKRPTARLTAPETVAVGESFELNGTESTDNIGIADYEWDFGNGTVINGSTLTETTGTYAEPGEYDVVLTVTDTSGNTDTNTTTIVAEGATATLSTDPVDFGEVGNNSAATESISISNDGTIALDVTDTTISGDNASAFRVTGDDEPRIRPGESQSLRVAFEPTAVGEKNATLEITTENNTGANSFEINLSGESIESNLTAVTSTAEFGSVNVGTDADQNVTLANDGTDNATIEVVELLGSDAGQFSVDSDLSTIAAGDTANVSVGFDPQAVGSQSATLRVETTDGDSTRVSLSGTGEGPQLNVPSTSRSAGSIGSGTDTTVRAELRNYGSQPLNVTNLTLTGDGSDAFEIDTDAIDLLIDPDNSATVELTFAPDVPDDYSTTLNVAHNDTTTDTAELVFSGTAVAADIDIDQSTLDFGTTQVGQPEFLNLTISNEDNAGAALNITSTSIVGSNAEDFSIVNPERPFTIAAGEERDLRVNFTALAAGAREAQLQINSDSNQGQTNVWLSNTRSYIVVQEVSNPTVSVDGRNLDEGSSRLLNVSTPSTRGSDVTVDELGFEMQRDGDFDLELSNSDSDFGNAFDADGDTEVIQYVGIDHIGHLSNETFEDTSLIYRVDRDVVPAGVSAEDVDIHRYDEANEEYVSLDPEFRGEQGSQYYYRVDTPGFSEFAITVTEPQDDTGGAGSSGSGGQRTPPPTIEPAADDQGPYDVGVDIERPTPGSTVVIDGRSTDEGDTLSEIENILFDRLSLHINTDREFRLEISAFDRDLTPSFDPTRLDEPTETRLRETAESFETQTGTVSAGYLDIQNDLAADELTEATVEFSVRRAYLDALSVESGDVSLYRGTADGWTALSTDQRGETDTHIQYTATTPGFSVFAIGTGAPTFAVTDAELDESTVDIGETATVTATVANRGQLAGEYTAELTADGEVVDSRTVELNGEESTEAELSFATETAGEYELAVGGTPAGSLTVEEAETAPAFWILLVGFLAVLLVRLWRRTNKETS